MDDKNIAELFDSATEYYYKDNFSLSIFLSQLLRIARKTNNYTLKFLVRMETLSADSNDNKRSRAEFRQNMLNDGHSEKQFKIIYESILEDYIARREIYEKNEKGQDLIRSEPVSVLEELLVLLSNDTNSLTIPSNLAPLDAYVLTNTYRDTKKSNFLKINQLTTILSKIKSFFFDFLTEQEEVFEKQNKNNGMELKKIMPINNKVFIVHGTNEAKRRELKEIITSMQLEPIVLGDQPNGSLSIFDKFDKYASECSVAIALITADDRIEDSLGKEYSQGRPNVWFELGWFYGKIGKNRTILLYENKENHSIPSDLSGILQIRFQNSVREVYKDLQDELESMGIGKIDGIEKRTL